MTVVLPRLAAPAALLVALSACQQLPKGLPYNVSDDCRVERRAQAPAPARLAAAPVHVASASPLTSAAVGATIAQSEGYVTGSSRIPPASRESGESHRGPSRRGGGGFGFGIILGLPPMLPAAAQPDATDLLTENGPQFPATFSMSCAPVQGFVRGGWPLVIDYRSDGRSDVLLEVHTTAAPQPYIVALERSAGRRLHKLTLPQFFGDTPTVGLFLVRAGSPPGAPGAIQLYGLGAGPRAVGSVSIDQVDFRPGTMRVSQNQKATYSFYSRSDFNRSVVEIMRMQRNGEEIRVTLARSNPLDFGINRGTWVGKKEPMTWDGLDGSNRVSAGPHLLQVRAWGNSQDARDWVAAWSPSAVVVSE